MFNRPPTHGIPDSPAASCHRFLLCASRRTGNIRPASLCRDPDGHASEPRNDACFIVEGRVEHRMIGQDLANRGDQHGQDGQFRFVAARSVAIAWHLLKLGDIDFLDGAEVRDVAFGCRHFLASTRGLGPTPALHTAASTCRMSAWKSRLGGSNRPPAGPTPPAPASTKSAL